MISDWQQSRRSTQKSRPILLDFAALKPLLGGKREVDHESDDANAFHDLALGLAKVDPTGNVNVTAPRPALFHFQNHISD
jgi:hypothetical protein